MAQTPVAPSRLLGLADELLMQIFQHVESKNDLCRLACSSQRLQGFAEPAIYNTILIRKGYQALEVFASILRRQARASFIRKLHIRYLYDEKEGIEMMDMVLKHLTKLKELLIEAPCCNDTHAFRADFESKGKIDYAAFFEFASSMTLGPHPRVQIPLESFTLHSHDREHSGREVFDMGKNALIFRHPTLRHLTISCFDIGENIEAHLSASKNSTSLKSLTFDECNITTGGLASILSVPKALERLTIGERIYNIIYNHKPLGLFPVKFLKALALQERSLQYIKHLGGRIPLPNGSNNLSMASFSSVREMEVESYSILTRILIETAPLWKLNLSLRMLLPCPQRLLEHGSERWNFPLSFIIPWLGWVSNLDFIVDFGEPPNNQTVVRELWRGKYGWKYLQQIANLLGQGRGQGRCEKRHLKIFLLKSTGFIPPYMFGEERPREELIFDSDVTRPSLKEMLENEELFNEEPDENEVSSGLVM